MESNNQQTNGKGGSDNWERDLVHELALESLKEKRRARRWGILFKLLTFVYLIGLLVLLVPEEFQETAIRDVEHTALVEVKGVIADEEEASAENIIKGLRDAYKNDSTKGVVLRINTPGGSPVQAGYINDEIRRLKKKHPKIPVYAVVTDICASGGYYIAAAADKIYVDKASIVGSIGVLMNGFGFVDGMQKLGIERRLMTAGEHKGLMDPFSPLQEFDRNHISGLLEKIHQQFIDVVKKGRGDRLKDDAHLFSGLFWTGEESVELGLADGIGNSSYVARELIGAEEIVDFTPAEDMLERFAKRMGAGATAAISGAIGIVGAPQMR